MFGTDLVVTVVPWIGSVAALDSGKNWSNQELRPISVTGIVVGPTSGLVADRSTDTMHWLKKSRWSVCLLSATAAAGLATPLDSWAQVKPGNTFGVKKPAATSPASRPTSNTAAPAAPGVEAAPVSSPPGSIQQTAAEPGSETAVQQELRRLYEESGREMPEVATPYRPNFQQPNNTAAPQVVNPAAQAQGGVTPPAPSKPAAGSGNPVSRFFKRILPGGNSKPTQTAATPAPQATRPTPPAAAPQAGQAAAPQRPSYTPYGGQQPRRLPNQEVVTAPPVQASPPDLPLPPPPVEFAPVNTSAMATPQVAVAPPRVQPKAVALPVAAPRPAEEFRPFEPEVAPQAVARSAPLPDDEPEFAPPVIVAADPMESPYQAIPLDDPGFDVPSQPTVTVAPPASAPELPVENASAPVVTADVVDAGFPDPFPEMSEEEADDELDIEEVEAPYAGLKLGEEAEGETADPFAEPAESAPVQLAEAAPLKTDAAAPALAAPLPLDQPEALTEVDGPAMPAAPQPLEELVATDATAPSPFAQELPAVSEAKPVPVESVEADPLPELALPELPALDSPASPAEVAIAPAPQVTVVDQAAKPISHQPTTEYDAKMALIRERGGMKGLKGFCPVTLRDERELRDAQPEIASSFRGQKFHFSSAEAKAKFDLDAARYVPAAYGADVVVLIRDKDVAEGSLDFAAWYKGKLYLFASEEAHNTFVGDPAKYATPPGLE